MASPNSFESSANVSVNYAVLWMLTLQLIYLFSWTNQSIISKQSTLCTL
eukprot:UN00312